MKLRKSYQLSRNITKKTLTSYLNCYNLHIKQKALGHKSPWEKVLKWYELKPEIFKVKPVYNLSRPAIKVVTNGYAILSSTS
jgi:hypothetical protein